MAAIAYPPTGPAHRRPARHLTVVPGSAGRVDRAAGSDHGHRGERLHPAVYRRRRLAALVLATVTVAVVILLLRAAAGALGGAPLTPSAPPAAGIQPVASVTYVVQPGDTYWSIARSLHGSGDVRAEVDQLLASRHGAPLRAGDRIAIP